MMRRLSCVAGADAGSCRPALLIVLQRDDDEIADYFRFRFGALFRVILTSEGATQTLEVDEDPQATPPTNGKETNNVEQ
eukprot:scaffold13694_cov71-Cyclotella_meneghiniana.AAC.12